MNNLEQLTVPFPLACQWCGASRLYLMHVICWPLDGPMEYHLSLLEGTGQAIPADRLSVGPAATLRLSCLACHKWTVLDIASDLSEGSTLTCHAGEG